jgi:pyrimidine operon attenuation protein / uracil phosphoribosyltransferase
MERLLDENAVGAALEKLHQAVAGCEADPPSLALVGVRSRGVPLAHRLAARLEKRGGGRPIPVGTLDITLYRDDRHQRRPWPLLRGTEIPFAVDDRRIVLVDDVIFTGRTAHAAIAALCALGRPAAIRLAVLIDRGLREFPIQPDYVGRAVTAAADQRINVHLEETDGLDEVVLT